MECSKRQNIYMYAIMSVILIIILIALVLVVPDIVAALELECDGIKEPDSDHKVWVDLEHRSLIEQYEVLDEWNESKFNYYVRNRYPANAQGMSYFQVYFGLEETQFVEEALGFSFDDPNSWNQGHIDLRAKELEYAIRHHETEYGIAFKHKYDFISSQTTTVVPSNYDWNTHTDTLRDFIDNPVSRVKVPDYEPDQEQAIARTQEFMAATMSTAGFIGGVAILSNHKSRTNQVVAILMVIIMLVAMVMGVSVMSGGNFELRNDHLLQYTQYFTYVFFGTMALVCIGAFCGEVADYFYDAEAAEIKKQIKQVEKEIRKLEEDIENIKSGDDAASYNPKFFSYMEGQINQRRKTLETLEKKLADHLANKQKKEQSPGVSEPSAPKQRDVEKLDRRLRRLLDATHA